MGADLFADALAAQAVDGQRVDWRPPRWALTTRSPGCWPTRGGPGERAALPADARGRATLVDVRPAREALGLGPGQFLHAGPPIDWERASGPLRGALIGAMLLEGLAADAGGGRGARSPRRGVELEPCHHRGAVGPMAGVVSPVDVGVRAARRRARRHRRGARSTRVSARCSATAPTARGDRPAALDGRGARPAAARGVPAHGPVDVKAIVAQMVQMGDEGHNRNRAGTLMFLRELLPDLVDSGASVADVADVVRFVAGNDHFFLNLVMPAGKLQTAAAPAILPGSTVVTTMARNGTDFGIQVSGTGDRWFTGPAQVPGRAVPRGVRPRRTPTPTSATRRSPRPRASAGFAMAAAPAIVRFVGGSVPDALGPPG